MSDALEQAVLLGIGDEDARFPTVLDRLIHLRTLPSLGQLAAGGLTYVATHAVERRYEAGETVYAADEPVTAAHFVVEGCVRVTQDGLHLLDGVPPFTIGFFPVLAGSKVGQEAIATEPTVTLELSRDDLLTVLEDDPGFAENAVRQMARQVVGNQQRLEAMGLLEREEPKETPYPHEPLDLLERLELMGSTIFEHANLEPFVQLVRGSEELRLEPGDVLWERGELSTWGVNVAHGVIACEADGFSFRMGPGSSLGYLESYGVLPRSYRAVAETRVVGMRQGEEVFFDVLEDHPKLAHAYISAVAGFLLDLTIRVAKAERGQADGAPKWQASAARTPRS